MRRLILGIVSVAVLGGLYYVVRQHGAVSLGFLEGKTVRAYRGDLERPITASGKIEPASVVQIKGKASGEVVETPFIDGAMVRKGDLIVRLNPIDEQRSVDRARSDYDRANIALRNAELSKKEREEVGVPMARAKRQQAEARARLVQFDFDKVAALRERERLSGLEAAAPLEYEDAKARLDEATAMVDAARVECDQAQIAVAMAEEEIAAAGATAETAQKVLEDAEERLRETKVYSPIDGMVLVRHVQIGEVVQSGKTSLTGGTVLMEIADVSDIYAVVNVDEADIGDVREVAPPSAVPGETATRPAAGSRSASQPATQEAPMATLPAETFDQTKPVEVTVESFPQEKFYGVIERIAPQSQLMQAIATFKVWIRITSPNRNRLVGLLNTQAEAHFKVRSVRDAVLVSCDAIMTEKDGDRAGVYLVVVNPETKKRGYKFQPCRLGIDNGIDAEVIEGLEEGQEVWTQLPQMTDREKEAEAKQKAKQKR